MMLMHILSLLLPFAVALPLTSSQLPSCPTYMVIEAPGLGDYYGGWTQSTTNAILSGLPGGVRYLMKSKEPDDSGPGSNIVSIIANATIGSAEIITTVATNFALCPKTKVVIFGYSYGSIVVTLAMNDPALLRLPIAAVIMYGNCFWHAGQTGNRGTATAGKSVCAGATPIGTPVTYQDVTADFCLVDDYLCTGTPFGWSNNSHWSYINSQWQQDAANFAIARIQSGNNIPIST